MIGKGSRPTTSLFATTNGLAKYQFIYLSVCMFEMFVLFSFVFFIYHFMTCIFF